MARIGFPVRWPSGRPVAVVDSTPFEIGVECLRAHVAGPLVDVDEFGLGPCLADPFDRGNEGVGDGDHGVAGTHAGGHQRKADRVGPAREADAELRSAVLRELALEAFDFGTADECGAADRLCGSPPPVPPRALGAEKSDPETESVRQPCVLCRWGVLNCQGRAAAEREVLRLGAGPARSVEANHPRVVGSPGGGHFDLRGVAISCACEPNAPGAT